MSQNDYPHPGQVAALSGPPLPPRNGNEQRLDPSVSADDPRLVRALEEYRSALERGEPPDPQEFLARHADIAETLAGCLAALEFVHVVAPQLDQPGADSHDSSQHPLSPGGECLRAPGG